MELPTYTNIWKIEKRLYKLYDFRLPMPLPVGQVTAFLAISVPYTLILTMVGMPFSHTWVWLYVLPPGVLVWLVTRPVLEGKRLPELVLSQVRYLGEPRTWCRMAPLTERDDIYIVARTRRSAAYARPGPSALAESSAAEGPPAGSEPPRSAEAVAEAQPQPTEPAPNRPEWPQPDAERLVRVRSVATGRADIAKAGAVMADPVMAAPVQAAPGQPAPVQAEAVQAETVQTELVRAEAGEAVTSGAARPAWPAAPVSAVAASPLTHGPGLRNAAASPVGPLNTVERALRTSPGSRSRGRREPVVVVPGGHRPGRPDQVQRDQARARLALPGPARVVVLGCTAGAGQTIVTLLTGQLLASLRGEPVAVLDLSQGAGSLTERARSIPVMLPSQRAGADPAGVRPGNTASRGLQVVTAEAGDDDAGQLINSVVARYPVMLADPAASCVPKSLRVADQLILVVPAGPDSAASLAMTLEWLEANDHRRLATAAITVLNGVSALTTQHAGKAAAVASGRCRAIVQVPWDERLRESSAQPLGTSAVLAYTALAGVLVSALTDAGMRSAGR